MESKKLIEDVFIYPTDTVWGIGCSIYLNNGQLKINQIKKSLESKPLSIIFNSIENLYEYFNLKNMYDKIFFNEFFKLETTLSLSKKLLKKNIPESIYSASGYINVRVLGISEVDFIYKVLNGPFFTTSLNITGKSPIVSFEEAKGFQEDFAIGSQLIFHGQSNLKLSGSSSTIIQMTEENNFKIIRSGKNVELIKKFCKISGEDLC